MVFCSKCGHQNEDEAQFCSKCGRNLRASSERHGDEWDKRCEDECAGGKQGSRGWAIFWGVVIIVIGLWIIVEFVLKNLAEEFESLSWIQTVSFPFWWVIVGIIALFIITTGIRIIIRNQ